MMTMEELMAGIELPVEARECVKAYDISEEEYQKLKDTLYQDINIFCKAVNERLDKDTFYLYFCVRLASERYELYADKVTRELYLHNCYDITLWCRHYIETNGRPGLAEGRWVMCSVMQRLWRLGRLQFEPDMEVLHVHIPEDGRLDVKACEESFAMAKEFFGDKYQYMDCHSWLLSPKLLELLDEKSNIIQFQKRFHVVDEDYFMPQAEERVFGYAAEDKEEYPENTTLQKRLKAYIKNGGVVGMGFGIIG